MLIDYFKSTKSLNLLEIFELWSFFLEINCISGLLRAYIIGKYFYISKIHWKILYQKELCGKMLRTKKKKH